MKATLIALMTLAGMASASSLTEIATMDTLVGSMSTVGTVATLDGYNQKVYSLDGAYINGTETSVVSALKGGSGVVTFAGWINLDSSAPQYNTIIGWGETGKGFKFGVKGDDLFYVTKNVKESVPDFAIPKGDWVLVALQYNTATKNVRLTGWNGDSTISADVTDNTTMHAITVESFSIGSANGNATSGNENFKGMISGLKVYTSDDFVGADVIAEAVGTAPKYIPEPATATLSLLALAGFAARRRRK